MKLPCCTDAPVRATHAPLHSRRAYEQLKLRYESLELRAQQAAAQLAAALQRAAEAEELQQRLGRLQAEHAALRASTEAATGSAAGELAGLRATVASLRDEMADLRSVNEVLRQQATRAAPASGSLQHSLSVSLAGPAGGEAGGELERMPSAASLAGSAQPLGLTGRTRTSSDFGGEGLLSPAASASAADAASVQLSTLAEKERELVAARQHAAALEAELADVERECALRQAQEQALKEAVRDLQREIERQRLPGKQGERRCCAACCPRCLRHAGRHAAVLAGQARGAALAERAAQFNRCNSVSLAVGPSPADCHADRCPCLGQLPLPCMAGHPMSRAYRHSGVSLPAVDMEYFKNVLLRLYETGEAESLLPVVAQVGGLGGVEGLGWVCVGGWVGWAAGQRGGQGPQVGAALRAFAHCACPCHNTWPGHVLCARAAWYGPALQPLPAQADGRGRFALLPSSGRCCGCRRFSFAWEAPSLEPERCQDGLIFGARPTPGCTLQVLQFSPAELERCRDALQHRGGALASAAAASEWQWPRWRRSVP